MADERKPRHPKARRSADRFGFLARWYAPAVRTRSRLARLVEEPWFHRTVMAAIVVTGVALGVETSGLAINTWAEPAVLVISEVLIWLFVIELFLRITAHGWRFFHDPWNVFDVVVVAVSVGSGPFAVFRLLRAFRFLRILSAVPALRRVVSGMLAAIPNLAAGLAVLSIILYVAAVTATHLYQTVAPEYFGDLGVSLFTLFQTMTGEAWPDIGRTVMQYFPFAWIFFVLFIVVTTFGLLNLLASAVSTGFESAREWSDEESNRLAQVDDKLHQLLREVQALRGTSSSVESDNTADRDNQ